MCLRAPSVPRIGIVFTARSVVEQRLCFDWLALSQKLDRNGGRARIRLTLAGMRDRRLLAALICRGTWDEMVSLPKSAVAGRKVLGRNMASHVCAGTLITPAWTRSLDGSHPD